MPRTSERLIRNGYYDMYGQPLISYRDMPNRRRRITGRPVHGEVTFRERFHSLEDNMTVQENQTMDTLIRDCYNIFVFVFVIFVVFACICRIISLHSRSSELYVTPTLTDMVTISGGEDQEYLSRLQSLEAKLEYLLPQADLWPNFALGSQGATILHKMTSKTYQSIKGCRWFGKLPPIGPNIVIQGGTDLIPGQCWAFEGFPGRLSVELSNKVTVTHVSLGHISKIVSPTASVSSAPREFSVYGKKNLEDEESHLGTFLYDEDGDRIQTFRLPVNMSN
ncbi:SUN domain-containing protein 2-like [Xiphophorus maculatus]|uniref:SUN domain-containing protein 2-like n=1 Tax=Xiphophorus maculatus TaxID=8083 RepID=UPI000C6C99A1|nr:SUN domain-containing protein 2-like [Xiphophorus maculatus]